MLNFYYIIIIVICIEIILLYLHTFLDKSCLICQMNFFWTDKCKVIDTGFNNILVQLQIPWQDNFTWGHCK